MNGVLIFIDFIWLLSVGGVWGTWLRSNKVWDSLHGIHVFAIVCSVIVLILKVIKKTL